MWRTCRPSRRRSPSRLAGRRVAAAALAAVALHGGAFAATLVVGPDERIRTLAEAARVAQDGDTVEIVAATYRGDVAVWTQRRLTLRGVGGRPLLLADGQIAEGKAIFVIRNGDFRVENLAFAGARADDRNGAGIRFENGRLVVRDCTFTDNENGILTGNNAAAELVVENSEFTQAPRDRGPLKHLLYVGRIGRFALTGSRFHDGYEGHLVKSRARVSDVRYNLLYDAPGGRAAYELEFPDGGVAYVVGNVIGQSAETTNAVVVAYGAEGRAWPDNALYLVHNTLVSERPWGAWFLRVWQSDPAQEAAVVAFNNLTVGPGVFGAGAPGTFDGNYTALSWALGNIATLDFTLAPSSLYRGRGVAPPSVGGESLAPTAEFRLPRGTRQLPVPATWTPGAYQRSASD